MRLAACGDAAIRVGLLILAFAAVGTMGGCPATRQAQLEGVAKDWCATIRASQVIPVYPPTADLLPGDMFLVDRPVRDAFREGSGHWEAIAQETSLGEWLLDLQKSCLLQLEAVGIQGDKIETVQECTCCHRELFFSYRRDNGLTGRQIGFMLLNSQTK